MRSYSMLFLAFFTASISMLSCDKCRDSDCPGGSGGVFHQIDLVDSTGKSVYGSSATQFNKAEVSVDNGSVVASFTDSILILNQRFPASTIVVSYNDTFSTTINIEYETVSPRDECCEDFQELSRILYNGVPLCDDCEIATIVL